MVFCFIMAIILLLMEAFHIKNNIRELYVSIKQIAGNGKVPVTFTFAYRVIQLIYCVCVVINITSAYYFCDNVAFVQVTYVLSSFTGILSLLFFLQLKEGVGHLLIVIQKMVYQTFLFSFMFGIFCMAFATALTLLSFTPDFACNNHPNKNIQNAITSLREGELPAQIKPPSASNNFSNYLNTLYETILLTLAIMPPSDIYFKGSGIPALSMVFYMVLVLIPGLVMVNFLIALMTRRAESIDNLKEDILKLEKLSLILFVYERQRVPLFLSKLYTRVYQWFSKYELKLSTNCEKCKCTTFIHKISAWLRNNYEKYCKGKPSQQFVYLDDGRVFVECVELINQGYTS